jgi:hypothetical protein
MVPDALGYNVIRLESQKIGNIESSPAGVCT